MFINYGYGTRITFFYLITNLSVFIGFREILMQDARKFKDMMEKKFTISSSGLSGVCAMPVFEEVH